MKISELIEQMKELHVHLPKEGRGQYGRIVAADLEHALGEYYLMFKYTKDPVRKAHCELRRQFVPMKAYRYDKLRSELQFEAFKDNNEWIAEKKYNGWRMMITYLPYGGFAFWGGNISDVDFLPTDYTDHIRIDGKHPSDPQFRLRHSHAFVLDAEALCYDEVEGEDGLFSSSTLGAISIILGSSPERALELQRNGATVIFKCFDMLLPRVDNMNNANIPLRFRKELMHERVELFPEFVNLQEASFTSVNKKQRLKEIWVSGEEGVILKNIHTPYINGGRLRSHAIKVKRTMSGEIGDDVDAFISGFELTDEWSKVGLIGSIQLSVYIEDNRGERIEHHIATVSGMPTEMRKKLTDTCDNVITLNTEHLGDVLVIDGQELSNKNRRIMHARVDWDRGFRVDKRPEDCVMKLKTIEKERF
jgi:ATP-dependent DNA ligase